jgi:hypothetical protein
MRMKLMKIRSFEYNDNYINNYYGSISLDARASSHIFEVQLTLFHFLPTAFFGVIRLTLTRVFLLLAWARFCCNLAPSV